MERFFTLHRFGLLERYMARETEMHCLMMAVFTTCIYLVNYLADMNYGLEYSTRGSSVFLLAVLVVLISPCILERGYNKRNAVFICLLPASTFEKFLHIWLKYLILMPLICVVTLWLINVLFLLSGSALMQRFASAVIIGEVRPDQVWMISTIHPLFFMGYLLFKRKVFLKTCILFVTCMAVCLAFIQLVWLTAPQDWHGAYLHNIASYPEYNYPLSAVGHLVVDYCNYVAPILFVLGSWITSYLLMREKEI